MAKGYNEFFCPDCDCPFDECECGYFDDMEDEDDICPHCGEYYENCECDFVEDEDYLECSECGGNRYECDCDDDE